MVVDTIFDQPYVIQIGITTIIVTIAFILIAGIYLSIFVIPYQKYTTTSAVALLTTITKEVEKTTKITRNEDLRKLIKNKLSDYKNVGRTVILQQVTTWFPKYPKYQKIIELQFMEEDKLVEILYKDKNKFIEPDLQIILYKK